MPGSHGTARGVVISFTVVAMFEVDLINVKDASVVEVEVIVGTGLVDVEVVPVADVDLIEEDAHKHKTPPSFKFCLPVREIYLRALG